MKRINEPKGPEGESVSGWENSKFRGRARMSGRQGRV